MQTEIPTLPVVHLNAQRPITRKQNLDLGRSPAEVKNLSPYKNVIPNRKCLHPLLGGPYISNGKQQLSSECSKSSGKSVIGQRVLSAKMLRFKELQNQLADAHYHLNELANENKLLKALQKRQDSALKRYEGTNAELPRIINSHHEELRVLQTKYKKLRALHKETCELLKEKENELQSLQSQNRHLLQLSKDRNLEEREKLQVQVSDLKHRIEQQQDSIQALHRKLSLESKSLKHQLHLEVSKRKETQRCLDETLEKLRSLENLLDNKEKRLYFNGQLLVDGKGRSLGSQSLTNLRDIRTVSTLKLPQRDKKWQKDTKKDDLNMIQSNSNEKAVADNSSMSSVLHKTETLTSLQQIRKFRLQKSLYPQQNVVSLDNFKQKSGGMNPKINDKAKINSAEKLERFDAPQDENNLHSHNTGGNKFIGIFNNAKYGLNLDFEEGAIRNAYSSEETESESEERADNAVNMCTNMAKNSRELHARLITNTDNTSDEIEDVLKITENADSRDNELEKILKNQPNFSGSLTKGLSDDIGEQKRNSIYYSNSQIEDEVALNENYIPIEHHNYNAGQTACEYSKQPLLQSNDEYTNADSYQQTVNETEIISTDAIQNQPKSLVLQESSNEEIGTFLDKAQEACQNLTDAIKVWSGNQQNLKRESTLIEFNNSMSNNKIECYDGESYELNPNGKYKRELIKFDNLPTIDNLTSIYDTKKSTFAGNIILGARNISNTEDKDDHFVHVSDGTISPLLVETTNGSCKTTEDKNEVSVAELSEYNKQSMSKKNSISILSKDISDGRILINIANKVDKKEELYSTPPVNMNNVDHTETRNKLNEDETMEMKNLNSKSSNNQTPRFKQFRSTTEDGTDNSKDIQHETKVIGYNKEKLLASMKAIDDNENIEFVNQGYQKDSLSRRKLVTENLFHGLPTQTKRKQDVIKDIFSNENITNKPRSGCNKLH
ncbi:hypothetical protein KM043_018117 [Ampulex compressa]|nr:hypothetical protein KM043_018117 [Ampulex compressa]